MTRTLFTFISFLVLNTFSASVDAKEMGSTFLSFGGLTDWGQSQRVQKVLSHRWWVELSFGYSPYEFMSVGAIYAIDQSKQTASGFSTSSENFESRDYRASLGPQIHFWFDPFYLSATYFLDSKMTSEKSTDGLSPYKYEGNGTSFELGFLYPISSIQFSFSVLYRSWKYNSRTQNGGGVTSLSPQLEETYVEPSLKTWWFF